MCLFTGLVAAVEHFIFSHLIIGTIQTGAQASFWQTPVFNISRSLILFVAGLVAALVTREIRRQVEVSLHTVQDRDRAVRIFGQYVSPQIAEKLLHQPVELSGELRNVCVMFLDIRNFSSYAAGQRPEAVMTYLNTLVRLHDRRRQRTSRHREQVSRRRIHGGLRRSHRRRRALRPCDGRLPGNSRAPRPAERDRARFIRHAWASGCTWARPSLETSAPQNAKNTQ